MELHSEGIKGVTHCTDYRNFCKSTVVPFKTVCCFTNNKTWITSNVKDVLNKKMRAFKDGYQAELKSIQGDFKAQCRHDKES